MNRLKLMPILLMLTWSAAANSAESETQNNLPDLSLEQLMEVPVSVASSFRTSQKEAPGIVTVFSADDIRTSGATDLMQLLELAPGFQMAEEVLEVTGLNFRGQWANEGKVLILINNIPMNELGYSSLQMRDIVPLSVIERIEIIRGPGSVIHGGQSELAVISIETKDHKSMHKFEAAGAFGKFKTGSSARQQFNLGLGHELTQESGLSVFLHQSDYFRSNSTYVSNAGATSDLASHTQKNTTAGFKYQYQSFKFNLLFNDYLMPNENTDYGEPIPEGKHRFMTTGAYSEYEFAISDALKLKAFFRYLYNKPWMIDAEANLGLLTYYDKTFQETNPGAVLTYNANESTAFSLGTEYKASAGKVLSGGSGTFFDGGTDDQSKLTTFAVFAESILKTDLGGFSLGMRHEKSNCCDGATVPRVAYTKVFSPWHLKFLASEAFRTPTHENVSYKKVAILTPERSQTFELEIGRSIDTNSNVTMNFYHFGIRDPLIYSYDLLTEGYQNGDKVGSNGAELEYKYLISDASLTANYSYSTPAFKIQELAYQTDESGRALGIANHKAVLRGELRLDSTFRVGSSAVYYSERTAFRDRSGTPVYEKINPYTQVNVWVKRNKLFTPGLQGTFGATNLFDADNRLLMAYYSKDSAMGDVPKRGTETYLRLDYKSEF